MAIDLANYEQKAREAVQAFWGHREQARQKQINTSKADQGERAGVTAGKNMDGFLALVMDADRYNILCLKLMQEHLYTAASLIVSPRSAVETGEYSEMSDITGLKIFASALAGHVAAEAARS
ncbi:MAG: hypothetical protein OXI94_21215 [Gemmatimonadota bacterium]|nr:hypothetical protein [Gemmatimonadota bacterium]